MKVLGLAAALAPSASLTLTHVAPWWAYLIAALAGPLAYTCRLIMIMRLGSKALDKVEPGHVSEVINAVTGYRGLDRPRGGSSRRTGSI